MFQMSANDSKDGSNIGTCHFYCLQGNMRRSLTSQLTLIGDIADKPKYPNGIDILFLTEPLLITKTNTIQGIPEDIFTCYVEKSGRAALETRNFTSWKCPQFCAHNISVCQVNLNNRTTYLVSMYMDITIQNFPKEFLDLINKVGTADIIIGTDTNSHCTLWNCVDTNSRGEFVEDFIIQNNFQCINVGNNWTFQGPMGKSIIDITISNYSLATKISNWKVENHLEDSDHFRIIFTINDCINFRAAETMDWNYKKGDWNLFQTILDHGLRNWTGARIWSDVMIESNLDTFLSQLNK